MRTRAVVETMPQKARSYWQYRVTWERGWPDDDRYSVKGRLLLSWKRVRDRVGILLSREPWRYFGSPNDRARTADDFVCCSGRHYDCGCDGKTVAEDAEYRRKDLPPIVGLKVERRRITVSQWEEIAEPEIHDRLPFGEKLSSQLAQVGDIEDDDEVPF